MRRAICFFLSSGAEKYLVKANSGNPIAINIAPITILIALLVSISSLLQYPLRHIT